MQLVLVHLVARIRDDVHVRLVGERAAWLWEHARRAFPNVLAAILMPNHLHVLAWVVAPALAHTTLVKLIAAFVRRFRWHRSSWERVPPPLRVAPGKEAGLLCYLALNAARKGLARDPLEWYWSTYLDLVGAIGDPWVSFERVRPYLHRSITDVRRLHGYVSDDRDVAVGGTPPPKAAESVFVATRPLDDILVAAIAATRGATGDHRRRGPSRDAFVWLAATQGWRDIGRLARICGVTRSAIHRILRGPEPRALAAARLVLGDARLLAAARGGIPPAPTAAAPKVTPRKPRSASAPVRSTGVSP